MHPMFQCKDNFYLKYLAFSVGKMEYPSVLVYLFVTLIMNYSFPQKVYIFKEKIISKVQNPVSMWIIGF